MYDREYLEGRLMRKLLCLLFILFASGIAAADLGGTFTKLDQQNDPGTPDGREGGETVADAFVIAALPFSDTGNTSDNLDDYDEVCPYTGSLSPDVVYVYHATNDAYLEIILCESSFDTKVYVYENAVTPGMPYACNDDADCSMAYRSLLSELFITSGNTYYIVIDGYGGEMGDYILSINWAPLPPCVLECPAGGLAEGEPTLEDGYIDNFNMGCQSSPYSFMYFEHPVLCAISGWYTISGGEYRDNDQFTITADENGYVTISANSEYDMFLFLLLPTDCNTTGIVLDAVCGCEIPGIIEFAHPAGTEAWIWFGPTALSGPVYEFDYVATFEGIEYNEPTMIDVKTWGAIKNDFMK